MTIHDAILAAMEDIAKVGIAKYERNKEQQYSYRGIETAMNAMAPIIKRHGITITPRYSDLTVTERESKSGGKLRFVTLKGIFRFTARDGSSIDSEYYGEGMDSSDKAVSKAQSVAFRTALFQQFIVPTMAIDPETGEAEMSRQDELREIADACIQKFDAGNDWGAFEEIDGIQGEELEFVWAIFKPHSKLRGRLKELAKQKRDGEKKAAPEKTIESV